MKELEAIINRVEDHKKNKVTELCENMPGDEEKEGNSNESASKADLLEDMREKMKQELEAVDEKRLLVKNDHKKERRKVKEELQKAQYKKNTILFRLKYLEMADETIRIKLKMMS